MFENYWKLLAFITLCLACLSKQICDRELSPVVGTLRVQEGQGTIVCVSGVATPSVCSSTPKIFTSPLTSFTRQDIVSPDDINQNGSPRRRRGYVNVLADCAFVRVAYRWGVSLLNGND